jgi:diguanylate cyclase (GGDEF)-like protein
VRGMGTSTVAIAVAAAAVVAFALVAWLAVRARNRADERTRDVLRLISDEMMSISDGLGAVVEGAKPHQRDDFLFPVTLDLDEALRRVAAVAAALPGMTGGAARVDRLDGIAALRSIGIVSGATGLEHAPDPPDGQGWSSALVQWIPAPGQTGPSAIRRAAFAPVSHNGNRIGLLGAYSASEVLPSEVVEAVVALAAAAAPGLAAAREHEAVRELVRTDPRTELRNERGLAEDLGREVARAARTGSPLSLLMIDLDNFSDVNKVNHAAGDDVLRVFARVLIEACRETDIPCRRGGDEFTIILPETACAAALRVEARIRALVATTDFPHREALSYSAGVTMLRDGDSTESIDRRASELVNAIKRGAKGSVAHDCNDLEAGLE